MSFFPNISPVYRLLVKAKVSCGEMTANGLLDKRSMNKLLWWYLSILCPVQLSYPDKWTTWPIFNALMGKRVTTLRSWGGNTLRWQKNMDFFGWRTDYWYHYLRHLNEQTNLLQFLHVYIRPYSICKRIH